ncbi:MAG: 16S rRNA (adenine(1518)-N(6)/adenine(1519)-N(6))-dimethyltransferase RsmA [Vulcanimicrobiaceae bacterium]
MRPRRSLGQHFLLDRTIADRVSALTLGDDRDVRVLEVGAGTGALTASLVEHGARVTALEIDAKLVALLRDREDLHGVDIVETDALAYPYDEYAALGDWRLAGNLPYNVGTPLVAEIARLPRPPQRMVVMLQKDVIDRLVAKPSTPAYGSLTLVVAARMRVRRAFTIGRTHFWPQPNVESSVAVLEPSQSVDIGNLRRFDEVVKAAFAYRRKTLVNSLLRALGAPRDQTLTALEALDLNPEIRAEQLDLATFAKLAAKLGG